MDKTHSSRIEADVRAILNQGGDPAVYRTSLASRHDVSLDVGRTTILSGAAGAGPS
mgnify:CR=1 FL=1